jgi:hypothetical protein
MVAARDPERNTGRVRSAEAPGLAPGPSTTFVRRVAVIAVMARYAAVSQLCQAFSYTRFRYSPIDRAKHLQAKRMMSGT